MNFFLEMSSMNLVRAGLDNQNLSDLLIPSGVGLAVIRCFECVLVHVPLCNTRLSHNETS